MNVPARLNNYPILHSAPVDGGAVVLAFREGHEIHPFVVAYWNGGAEWWHGDYRETLLDALASFDGRVRRMGGAVTPDPLDAVSEP